jgi:hypothetical protein
MAKRNAIPKKGYWYEVIQYGDTIARPDTKAEALKIAKRLNSDDPGSTKIRKHKYEGGPYHMGRRNPPSKRKQRKMAARVRWADSPAKKNAPRMKRLNKSTPWIPATAVKIVRNKGRYEVLYRRKRSAVKKRPARRKTARRR